MAGLFGFFHIGTLLIFAGMVLLVFVSVSVPVWDRLAFLKIHAQANTLALGNWGTCTYTNSVKTCSPKTIGYNIASVVANFIQQPVFANSTESALRNISRAFILHPIAAGIAFLAWLTALGAHRIGFLFSSLIALVASVVALVAIVLDFVILGIIKRDVNRASGGVSADYSTAIWLVVAAFACLVLGSLTVCCGCFTDRRRRARSTY